MKSLHRIILVSSFLIVCSLLNGQQLCDGNLGLNIFENGDFGSGSANVLQLDPNIAPGYIYSNASASPQDGLYTITNDMALWNFQFPTWLAIGDNSDDPNGYMMVVNASFEPGLFYSQAVEGLCENTLYEFSADIINLIRIPVSDHIEPNIDFLLDDVVRFSTGNIAQDASWNKYGFTFTTDPGQTSAILSLRNNAPGGGGNDLALDNISFQACGPDAFVTAEQTIFLCENDNTPVNIQAELSASNQSLQWQISLDSITWEDLPNANSESIVHSEFEVGRYYYRYISAGSETELLNENCRIFSDVLVIEILALNYTVIDTICTNEIYTLGSQELTISGDYFESFISSRGCDSLVDLKLIVLPEELLDLVTTLTNPTCFGESNGTIEMNILNETISPYCYAIDEVKTSNNLFEGLAAGNYALTITNGQNCETILDITLTDPALFEINVPADTIIDLGEDLDVLVTSNYSIIDLNWNPNEISPCGNCPEFNFIPLSSQLYTATATNDKDCIATEAFQVTINIDDLDIYIPNVFDPSLTGLDKSFTIGAKEGLISSIDEFSIYDRWGNLIHHSSQSTDLNLWDGRINDKEVNPGVYVYLLVVEFIDGNDYTFIGDLLVLK